MMSDGGSPGGPRHQRHFKPSAVGIAGQKRRDAALIVGKERRDAVVRAKRFRRADIGEDGEAIATDDVITREDALRAVQELEIACYDTDKFSSNKRVEALKKLRRLLSGNLVPPVDVVIQAGVISLLVKCLSFGSSEEQLLETAWCITNIASGNSEETRSVLTAVPLLIAHVGERSAPHVAEQCAWALGNIAGEDGELRDLLLEQGALRPLARLVLSPRSSLVSTACWALSNLIKGPKPRGALELINMEGFVEALVQHMMTGAEALVAEAAWVCVYLSAMSDTHADVLIHAGLLPVLARWLATTQEAAVLTPVLRSLGNIVSGQDYRTDAVVQAGQNIPGGVLHAIVHCLQAGNHTLKKEGAWVISNMAAGSTEHKMLVFSEASGPLLHVFATEAFDVRKEAAYALGNMCVQPKAKDGTIILEHLVSLVDRGCVAGFVNLIRSPDQEASRIGLQFLELVLRGLPYGQGPKVVEKEDGISAIENLQFVENDDLRHMANELMDKYFAEDYGLDEDHGYDATDQSNVEYPPWRRAGNR